MRTEVDAAKAAAARYESPDWQDRARAIELAERSPQEFLAYALAHPTFAPHVTYATGINPFAVAIADLDDATLSKNLEINVLGVVHSCRAEAPHMAAAGRGLIINVASAAAFVSAAAMGAYNASKAAVVALSETLHHELAADGVQVTVAMPGFFRTRLMEHARAAADARAFAERLMDRSSMSANEIAGEILARAAAGETHLVLPATYRWLWRFKRLAPRSFMRWLARQRWRRPSQGG